MTAVPFIRVRWTSFCVLSFAILEGCKVSLAWSVSGSCFTCQTSKWNEIRSVRHVVRRKEPLTLKRVHQSRWMISPETQDYEMHDENSPTWTDNGRNVDLLVDAASQSEDMERSDNLFSMLPEADQSSKSPGSERKFSTLADKQALLEDGMNIKPIGIVRSIYRLCVGTPRQGLLAPQARGYIDMFTLGNASPASSVDGLEKFSHIWIVFIFHLNTVPDNNSSSSSASSPQRFKSKISPPALGGEKVGIFATRSPHRFNPIGMSLCQLDRIERLDKRNVRIHISGMDLVDGTPVVDIKPYVPFYDSVASNEEEEDNNVRLPIWVKEGLSLQRTVMVSDSAQAELQSILTANPNALEFFGPSHGDETIEGIMENVLECIRQVLAMDVRSSYQTKRTRAGTSRAERSIRLQSMNNATTSNQAGDSTEISAYDGYCTQQLDNLLIYFETKASSRPTTSASSNSGAEDILLVTSIQLLGR